MATRQAQPQVDNAPTGNPLRGKLTMAALQRQALGNMANKQIASNLDTKDFKSQDEVRPNLVRRTFLTQKAENKPSQLTKALRAKPKRVAPQPKQEPTNSEVIDLTESSPETPVNKVMETMGGQQQARTPTPQPMDVSEVAGEMKQRLLLVDDVDQDMEDPYACAIYVQDIYCHLKQLERELHPSADYMSRQPKINHKMRAILVDWLALVHAKFTLLQETFYLSVAIIDRFLEAFPTSKEQLQLVGVTATFLASKYEEIYYPEIEDFVYITDNSYNSEQIRQMERIMLRVLEYNLGAPSAIQFLRRYSKLSKATAQVHTMAKYFIEVSLMDYSLLKYLPSQIAAGSLALAMELQDHGTWTPTLAHHSGYSVVDLIPVKRDLAKTMVAIPLIRQQAIRDKYSSQKFLRVAKHTSLGSSFLKRIAETK